jgi:hypothetical protein
MAMPSNPVRHCEDTVEHFHNCGMDLSLASPTHRVNPSIHRSEHVERFGMLGFRYENPSISVEHSEFSIANGANSTKLQ